MDVLDYLEAEDARPFVWGETDCATTADRWFTLLHGYSPMTCYGRVIENEAAGNEWLSERGGLARGMYHVMRDTGASRVTINDIVATGAIGVIVVDQRACIAIFNGSLWRSRDVDGLIYADDTHRFIAWDITKCRKHLAHSR